MTAPKKPEETPKGADQKPAPTAPTIGEKFTEMVKREYAGNVGKIELSGFQKRLIQNYFISIDNALKVAEERRLKKSEQYRDPTPITWDNVNLQQLAMNVVACSRIGYDPALPNHINMVPYKNGKTNKYDIGFVEGYRGKELKAKKYGYEVPNNVIVKLVYANEEFHPIYKDKENAIESYIHKAAPNPFIKGSIVGGYYYHEYAEKPENNKLMFYSLAEIEKRKPQYASTEFWGGEKTKYDEKGKKNGTETVEGWHDEMCWKTVHRMAYNAITIDSQKIDDDLMRMIEIEKDVESYRATDHQLENSQKAIAQGANKEEIIMEAEVIDKQAANTETIHLQQQPDPKPSESLFEADAIPHKRPEF